MLWDHCRFSAKPQNCIHECLQLGTLFNRDHQVSIQEYSSSIAGLVIAVTALTSLEKFPHAVGRWIVMIDFLGI